MIGKGIEEEKGTVRSIKERTERRIEMGREIYRIALLAGGRIGQGEGRARRKEIQENNGYRKNDRGRYMQRIVVWNR